MLRKILITVIIFNLELCGQAQTIKNLHGSVRPQVKNDSIPALQKAAAEIFQNIEKGIAKGSIREFSKYFAGNVYITLLLQESNYYSKNQSEAILSSFFAAHKTTSFFFSRIDSYSNVPYATGRYAYIEKGSIASAQIYVSLSLRGSKWVITQFNVY